MRQLAFATAINIAMLLTAAADAAQRPPAAKFDLTKPLTVRGIVTQIDWATPNVHILMKAPPGQPRPALWAVQLESAVTLAGNGWSETSLPVGETIAVDGFAARDGSRQIWAKSVVVTRTGSTVFTGTHGSPPKRAIASGPAPRWPDGRPRLGPPPGETGYWGKPSRTALVEDGVDVKMDAYGLLSNIADAGKVAPMQPWARGLYELRQFTFLKDDPMYRDCKPPGGPRQFQQVYGFQFVEQPELNRVFVLLGSGNRNQRRIYTDGRPHVGQPAGDADNPLYYGYAVGRWEGETFIVDVRNFNEKHWFDNGGLPHTERLRLLERFTRVDMKTMRYDVTIDDPGAYTRPWTSSWTLEWIRGEELPYFLCEDNRP